MNATQNSNFSTQDSDFSPCSTLLKLHLCGKIKAEYMSQKFIIKKNGTLVMGNVGYHFELFDDIRDRIRGCYGGGFYEIDDEAKVVRLSGSSSDFGDPDVSWLIDVPETYGDYTFTYKGKVVYPLTARLEGQKVDNEIVILPTDSRQVRRKKERELAKRKNKQIIKL